MRADGDPHLKRADQLAKESHELYLRHSELADDHDWRGEFKLADFHRTQATRFRDDAEHYAEMGTTLVPMF